MLITNNEERTVEKAARKYAPRLKLKQWKYVSGSGAGFVGNILSDLAVFNKNKERAFVRRSGKLLRYDADAKEERELSSSAGADVLSGINLLRRDEPETAVFGEGSETGTVYQCDEISEQELCSREMLEIFANPHASTLERLP